MPYVSVTCEVNHLDTKNFKQMAPIDFYIDSLAYDCVMPTKLLASLQIEPEGSGEYQLADGTTRTLQYGFIRIFYQGTPHIAKVVFAEDEAEPSLGVAWLNDLEKAIDTKGLRLFDRVLHKPIRMLLRLQVA